MRLSPLVPLGVLAAVVFAGVSAAYIRGRSARDAPGRFSVKSSSGGFPRIFTSPGGESITLMAPPRKVIALDLSAEEIILALSGPERFAAVTEPARKPLRSNISEQVKAVSETVNSETVERIVRLRPDLVLVTSYTDSRGRQILERCGVPVFPLPGAASLESIREKVRLLGQILGAEGEASRILSEMDTRMGAVRKQIPTGEVPRALYVSGYGDFWVAGSHTVIDEVVRLAGCVNVASENGVSGFRKLTKETLIRWNPEWLIVEGEKERQEETIEPFKTDPALAPLSALREEKVFVVAPRTLTSVSHHVVDAVIDIFRTVHSTGVAR